MTHLERQQLLNTTMKCPEEVLKQNNTAKVPSQTVNSLWISTLDKTEIAQWGLETTLAEEDQALKEILEA